uniref:Uncharacterized protein n=1 Tax=Mustela putorius furo TaxID=9669 RepID=M3YEB5_MUSPF
MVAGGGYKVSRQRVSAQKRGFSPHEGEHDEWRAEGCGKCLEFLGILPRVTRRLKKGRKPNQTKPNTSLECLTRKERKQEEKEEVEERKQDPKGDFYCQDLCSSRCV